MKVVDFSETEVTVSWIDGNGNTCTVEYSRKLLRWCAQKLHDLSMHGTEPETQESEEGE